MATKKLNKPIMNVHRFLQFLFGFFSIIGYLLTQLRVMSEKGFEHCSELDWAGLVFAFALLAFLAGFIIGTRIKNENK
jgi:hypothetical protein